MVKVADKRDVPDKVWMIHEISEEPMVATKRRGEGAQRIVLLLLLALALVLGLGSWSFPPSLLAGKGQRTLCRRLYQEAHLPPSCGIFPPLA